MDFFHLFTYLPTNPYITYGCDINIDQYFKFMISVTLSDNMYMYHAYLGQAESCPYSKY